MDKALVFGTKDCRFESCQGQLKADDANGKCIGIMSDTVVHWCVCVIKTYFYNWRLYKVVPM